MRDILRNRWMSTAIVVEVLGLVAAFGTIPRLGFPVALLLSLTAILSALGVVIVTIYFLQQYTRRPLNAVQTKEIEEKLAAYLTRQEAKEAFAPKSQLTTLGNELQSFLKWRYESSVLDFATEVQKLRSNPGHIVVAELEQITETTHIIQFVPVPPPVSAVGDHRGSAGDPLPELHRDYGTLFRSDTVALVVYLGVSDRLRALPFNPQKQSVFYYGDLSAPVVEAVRDVEPMPRLTRSEEDQSGCRWYWADADV